MAKLPNVTIVDGTDVTGLTATGGQETGGRVTGVRVRAARAPDAAEETVPASLVLAEAGMLSFAPIYGQG